MQEAEVDKVIGRVHGAVDKIEKMASVGNRNSQNFTLQTSSPVGWICAIFAIVACLSSFFSLVIALDSRNQARAERIEIMNKIQALENTDNAIRAYINTGRMPPKKEEK